MANNPRLKSVMLEGLEKEGYKQHPAVKENIEFKSRIEDHLKPLRDENAELKKRLDQREHEDAYARQRDSVRKAPFGFNDEKIKKLEERMQSPDSPMFPPIDSQGRTAYQAAAMHFAHQDSPVGSSTFPVMDWTGPSKGTESWRGLLTEPDKTKNPLHMNRRERRRLGDKLWDEAKDDYISNHNT